MMSFLDLPNPISILGALFRNSRNEFEGFYALQLLPEDVAKAPGSRRRRL